MLSLMAAVIHTRLILNFSICMQLTDAMKEAKDTHRYLKRLDETWAPLYQDLSIGEMQQLLPGLLSSIRSMQTVCRCAHSRAVLPAVAAMWAWLMPLLSWRMCSGLYWGREPHFTCL